jgi:hypothetical protein
MAAVGVLIAGLIMLIVSLARLRSAYTVLFVAGVWALSSSAARLLWVGGYISGQNAMEFSGTLSFAIIPICLWVIWVTR